MSEGLPRGFKLFNIDETENETTGERKKVETKLTFDVETVVKAVIKFKSKEKEKKEIKLDIPTYNFDKFSYEGLKEYINTIYYNYDFSVKLFDPGVDIGNWYQGSNFDPIGNRMYFIPNSTGLARATWHYLDLATNLVVEYEHGLGANHFSITGLNYSGGIYVHEFTRIYFIPVAIALLPGMYAHYLDCSTNQVTAYLHQLNPILDANADYLMGCIGAVLSPKQRRIYLIPYTYSTSQTYGYIDIYLNKWVSYDHLLGINKPPVSYAFAGGCYSPTENKIYLVPHEIGAYPNWYYIDCNDGTVVRYAHELGDDTPTAGGAYTGGIYSPSNNRIYLCPFTQATRDNNWHYIDCNTGKVVHMPITNTSTLTANYGGCGVYVPPLDKIFLAPTSLINSQYWHYIDCKTATVVAYESKLVNPTYTTAGGYYNFFGGVYSPGSNRVYFAPNYTNNNREWIYIDLGPLSDTVPATSLRLMANPLYNKTSY